MSEVLPFPELDCYREYDNPPEIVPGRIERDWMDATTQHFAYRCTPLPIANSSGWEIVLPMSFSATWNGGPLPSDVTVASTDGDPRLAKVVGSVFGHGMLTFHPGYLFKTSPGWALSARGAPNTVKDGIVALEGLIETDWLPFPFTMNWRFTRMKTVRFRKGEPFCFLSLVPHAWLDDVQPRLRGLEDDKPLHAAYAAWRAGRVDFQSRVAQGDPEAIKQGWQRDYVHGREPTGAFTPSYHLSKRRLKAPK
jgi:hypothetical protein